MDGSENLIYLICNFKSEKTASQNENSNCFLNSANMRHISRNVFVMFYNKILHQFRQYTSTNISHEQHGIGGTPNSYKIFRNLNLNTKLSVSSFLPFLL